MRKIVFTVTTDLNHDQRMQRICGSMAAKGYAVELVGRVLPVSEPLLEQPYRQHRLRCFFTKGKLFYLEYAVRLFLYLFPQKNAIYCAIDLDTVLPVYLRAKLAGKPFVYDAHEYFPEVVEVTNRKAIKAIWTAIEGFIVRRTRYAYTVSASIADVFYRKYGTSFEVIRNMPLLIPYKAVGKIPGTILYQGAVNEGRGLEQLVQAMAGIEAQLIICGKGDVLDKLQQQVIELNIGHKVIFKGNLLPQDLLQITRTAYIGVMLLENRGLSYYYSLANKFFDYIHAGVPQVVVDFPEYRLLNEHYEVALYSSLNVAELQQQLNRLLSDTDVYQRLEANCLKARQELNWQQEEQKLWKFYDSIGAA